MYRDPWIVLICILKSPSLPYWPLRRLNWSVTSGFDALGAAKFE